jgi:hypothetical protein
MGGKKKYNLRQSIHSILGLAHRMLNGFDDIGFVKNVLINYSDKNKNKKINKKLNNNKKNKGNTQMKKLKLLIFSAMALAVTVTVLLLNHDNNAQILKKQDYLPQIGVNNEFSGQTEFTYKPDGNNRVWHVINTYSSSFADNPMLCNNSEYTFTKDSVTVYNTYAGISKEEFFANK